MKRKGLLSSLYIILILFLIYAPMLIIIAYSFNASENNAIWTGFTLDWYRELFSDTEILHALIYSIQLALYSTLVSVVIGTLAAVGMKKYMFRGKGVLNALSYLPIMLPEIILGVAFLMFFSILKLPFGMLTLVISHVTFCIPFILILVRARLFDLDSSIEEAARDLGASAPYAFLTVTLPLIAPAVLSGALLSIAMSFDDVIISSFTMGMETPLPIKIYSMLKLGMTPEINALCAVTLVVIFLVVGLFQVSKFRRKN